LCRTSGAAVALTLAVAGLGACGGDGGGGGQTDLSVSEQIGTDGDAKLARLKRAEDLIGDCMRDQGFDYVPVDPVAQQEAVLGTKGLSDEEYVALYGDGITTLYEERLQLAELGPNLAIRAQLSPPEQLAYDRTLYGDDPMQTLAVAFDTDDFSRLGGCTKKAANTVFGGAQLFESLVAKLDDLDARVTSDPRVVEAIGRWSRCMKQRGYDYVNPEDIDADLEERLEEIVGPPDERDPDYDRAALAELQREEVAVMSRDLVCEEKHIADIEDEVQAEYEREFRERNADVLAQVPAP
jgi:hypothetical protein